MAGKILAGIDIGSRRTRARLNGWLKESGLRRVLHPSLRLLKGTSPNPCNVMNTLETITPLCMEVHHLHVTHLEVQHNLDTSVKRKLILVLARWWFIRQGSLGQLVKKYIMLGVKTSVALNLLRRNLWACWSCWSLCLPRLLPLPCVLGVLQARGYTESHRPGQHYRIQKGQV